MIPTGFSWDLCPFAHRSAHQVHSGIYKVRGIQSKFCAHKLEIIGRIVDRESILWVKACFWSVSAQGCEKHKEEKEGEEQCWEDE
jgi:hypothetical protein